MYLVRVALCGLLLATGAPVQARVVVVDEGEATLRGSITPEKPKWRADTGSDVESTIKLWAKTAKWSVVWDTPANYGIVAPMVFSGDFVEASVALIRKYENGPEPLFMDVSPSQRLLHITKEKTQ